MSPRLILEDEEEGLRWWSSGWNPELPAGGGASLIPGLGTKIPHEAKN